MNAREIVDIVAMTIFLTSTVAPVNALHLPHPPGVPVRLTLFPLNSRPASTLTDQGTELQSSLSQSIPLAIRSIILGMIAVVLVLSVWTRRKQGEGVRSNRQTLRRE